MPDPIKFTLSIEQMLLLLYLIDDKREALDQHGHTEKYLARPLDEIRSKLVSVLPEIDE